jgi:hypothetical protein
MATLPALRPSYTSWTAPGSDGIPGSLRPAPPPQLPPKVLPTTAVSTAGASDAKIVRKGLERAGYGAGRVASASLRAAPAVGALAGFGDYGIDDPGFDSSLGGTARAMRQGNLGDAGRSLSKGALDRAAYAECLTEALDDDAQREALVAAVSGQWDDPALAALSDAQSRCARSSGAG